MEDAQLQRQKSEENSNSNSNQSSFLNNIPGPVPVVPATTSSSSNPEVPLVQVINRPVVRTPFIYTGGGVDNNSLTANARASPVGHIHLIHYSVFL